MGHWEFEHSAETEAEPAAVWELYTDVAHWKQWSPEVAQTRWQSRTED